MHLFPGSSHNGHREAQSYIRLQERRLFSKPQAVPDLDAAPGGHGIPFDNHRHNTIVLTHQAYLKPAPKSSRVEDL